MTINAYGFDTDDPDGVGGSIVPQAVIPGVMPCGLPYKWENFTFPDESGNNVTRLIKSVNFEQWFAVYWRFDESKLTYVKRNGSACSDAYCLNGLVEPNLVLYKQFGAVPPFPEIDTVNTNFDCKVSGGGTISSLPLSCSEPSGTTSDLGCKYPEMSCSPAVDRPVITVFDVGDWTINANLKGHGTIVVDGNLTVNGDFEYWGTIIVNGTLTLGAGNATVHGGLVADSTLRISGNITVEGGGTITNVPTGRSIVTGRGWWER
ncbi:MAG: polymer-forming cytoskeletal protein [Armatimonadetes bacterium]|nr:polymer-forming cytoskeletal protein [Armatimonadota bacterium]